MYVVLNTNCYFSSTKFRMISAYRFGELPRYLKEINENKAERRRVEAEIDPNCPEGHIALSEHERIEALEMADKCKKIASNILPNNKQPIIHSLPRACQRAQQDAVNISNA